MKSGIEHVAVVAPICSKHDNDALPCSNYTVNVTRLCLFNHNPRRALSQTCNLAMAFGSLDVDHALAAAISKPIIVSGSALAIPILGNRKNERALFRNQVGDLGSDVPFFSDRLSLGLDRSGHADDVVLFTQVHAPDPGTVASHRPPLLLVDPDTFSIMRTQHSAL